MDKQAIIINVLSLLPALIQGVEGALPAFNKLIALLHQQSVTPQELTDAIADRDAVLQRIIVKTEAAAVKTDG